MAINCPHLGPCPLFLHSYSDLILLLSTKRGRGKVPPKRLWIGRRSELKDAGLDSTGLPIEYTQTWQEADLIGDFRTLFFHFCLPVSLLGYIHQS